MIENKSFTKIESDDEHKEDGKFPKDFAWGATTSAYQVSLEYLDSIVFMICFAMLVKTLWSAVHPVSQGAENLGPVKNMRTMGERMKIGDFCV